MTTIDGTNETVSDDIDSQLGAHVHRLAEGAAVDETVPGGTDE